MKSKKKLAIIIPAYKIDFIEKTLISISNQTNKNFRLYIGDDASPNDIKGVVSKFSDRMDIVYKRFEENFGERSLSTHWNRCINLAVEDWIWLFSDDDLMDSTCVESFYALIDNQPCSYNMVFKFQTNVIDLNGKIIIVNENTSNSFNTEDLIKYKYCNDNNFYAIEFIFSKKNFLENNGYIHFPLGWGSDAASVFVFGKHAGFLTIPESKVHWRWSDKNISSKNDSLITIKKKLIARLLVLNYIITNFSSEIESFKTEILQKQTSYPFKLKHSIALSLQVNYARRLLVIFNSYSRIEICKSYLLIYKNYFLHYFLRKIYKRQK